MALYGVGLDVTVKKIHLDLKLAMARQRGKTLKGLENIFTQADKFGYGKLSKKEFEACLGKFGFFPKITDLQALYYYYDQDKSGIIDYANFLTAMRDPLSERRVKLIEKAWKKLDPSNTGIVDCSVLVENFEAAKNKDVLGKVRSKDDLLSEFLAHFDKIDRVNKSGKITKQDLYNYYTDLGVSIPSDQFFAELLQGTWLVVEDETSTVKKEAITNIIKNFRYKLIQLSKGSQDEYLLRKIFKEFDLNKNGYMTIDELNAMMVRLEMPIHGSHLAAVFATIDKNKSGYIEFEEFVYFLVNDPYP